MSSTTIRCRILESEKTVVNGDRALLVFQGLKGLKGAVSSSMVHSRRSKSPENADFLLASMHRGASDSSFTHPFEDLLFQSQVFRHLGLRCSCVPKLNDIIIIMPDSIAVVHMLLIGLCTAKSVSIGAKG